MSLRDTELERLATYNLWGKGRIGDYIDRGGFGQVYDLHDLHEDGTVDALKVVTIEYTKEAEARKEDKQKYLLNGLRSTLDEIHHMMEFEKLNHFVSIYGYEDYPIRENGELIGYDILIRMEKLTVLTKYMDERSKQGNPITERDFLQIAIDVCTGLCEANLLVHELENYQAEFIHRDIKPENIFVSADGTYKLGDLGVATMKQRTQYSTVGTPSYMAPEMFLERGYHANVDLFALGRTLEKLTDGIHLRSGLQQVICRAEELLPENRYQNAQEMLADLNQCVYRLEHPEEFVTETNISEKSRPVHKWSGHTERVTEKMTIQLPGRTMKVAGAPELASDPKLHDRVAQQKKPVRQKVPEVPAVRKRKGKKIAAAIVVFVILAAVGGFGGWMFWQNQQTESKIKELEAIVSVFTDQSDYASALKALEEQSELVQGNEELSKLMKQCEDSYRESVVKNAEAANGKGDLENALDIIQKGLNVLKKDTELLKYQNDYKNSYRESIVSQAKAAYEEEDNEAALKMIEQGLEVLPGDKELVKYQELCMKSVPVALHEMELTDSNLGVENSYADEMVSDSKGNRYNGYFKISAVDSMLGFSSSPGYNTFQLDSDYAIFQATYFVKPDTASKRSARFLILADGIIVYDSGYKSQEDAAETISLDVSNVSQLTIETEANNASLFSPSPAVIVTNTMLKKPFVLQDEG